MTNAEILRQQGLLEHQAQEIEVTNTALSENNIELAGANERLTALNTEKDEIMSIVAHDLKNPISAVTGFTDILRDPELPEADKNAILDQLGLIGNRMLELVKNVLDSYRMESGGIELRIVALDVTPVIAMTVEMYRERAAAKDITLHWSNPPKMNTIALVDEQIFNQVLDNILSNAVKYSPLGKNVYVRLRHSSLAIGQEEGHSSFVIGYLSNDNTNSPMTNSQFLRIEVEDEGLGISGEDMKKLFGKFARLTARPTGGEHSTGLGLSIVKKMVEAMNGRVWCESELGKGATFIVELPLQELSQTNS
jgi:signal transduction histidine kinase